MLWRTRTKLVLALATLAVAPGCANSVARVARVAALGPVQADPDRGLAVEEDGDTLRVAVPVIASGTSAVGITECSVWGGWVDPVTRDSLVALGADDFAREIVTLDGLGPLEVSDPLIIGTFPEEGPTRDTRRIAGRATITAPPILPGVHRNSVGDLNASLVLQVWLARPADDCERGAGPVGESSAYVIDFSTVRPAEGAATGAGALIVAVVALTGLVAVGVGGS